MISASKALIRRILESRGYTVSRRCDVQNDLHLAADEAYQEREEYGASNIITKLENLRRGEPFEYPDILNLNHAVTLLVKDSKTIIEIGSGTGTFATIVAKDASKHVVASELDPATWQWCLENIKPRQNLQFVNGSIDENLLPFDLAVSIEVVEHVADFPGFLREMSRLAPRSLITTPNRKRTLADYHCGPPNYFKHVREWTAGEFYWVLRSFWKKVDLYGLTSQTEPEFIKVNVDTHLSPLIAECSGPLRDQSNS